MSYISDFKSAPFDIYNQNNTTSQYSGTVTLPSNGYLGTGLNNIPDYGLDALLNSKWATEDGRILTLVSNAATAIVGGVAVQSAAEITAFEKLAMTVPTATPATAGTYQILVTNGSTVLKQNLFAGGYLVTASGTGIGQTLKIASHAGGANAGTFLVTLEDPIQVTLDATTTVSLVASPAKWVIINPTTPTGILVGVTLYNIGASTLPTWNGTTGLLATTGTPQYAFVVSHGPVSCLIDSSVTNVAYPLGQKAATAGCLGIATLTTSPQVAISMQTLTSAQNGMVYLQL